MRVQVCGQTGKVQGTGRGVGARSGDVVEGGEDRVEEREGVAELRELEEEAEDGDVRSCLLSDTKGFIVVLCNLGLSCLPAFSKTK